MADFTIDPYKTTIAELLEIAEQSNTGILTIKGECEDGSIEWGLAVVINDDADRIIDAINETIDAEEVPLSQTPEPKEQLPN